MATYARYIEWDQPINAALLDAELRAALGGTFAGLTFNGTQLGAVFVESPSAELLQQALAVLEAHDPEARTLDQQQRDDDLAAGAELRQMITNRIEWHADNPVTAQNAVQVLTRMQQEWVYLLRLIRAGQLR